ncbi:hypothetical protein ACVWXS_004404 [Lysinibacillus sp. TE18511]
MEAGQESAQSERKSTTRYSDESLFGDTKGV